MTRPQSLVSPRLPFEILVLDGEMNFLLLLLFAVLDLHHEHTV